MRVIIGGSSLAVLLALIIVIHTSVIRMDGILMDGAQKITAER